jgi:hypothetical protein
MKPCIVIFLVLTSVACCGLASAQGPTIDLTLSSDDILTNILPGSTVTIDVLVEPAGDVPPLAILDTTVTFDPSLLGLPLVTAGPLFTDVFTPTEGSGQAGGNWVNDVDFVALPDAGALFFSFDVQAQSPGQGVFSFSGGLAEDEEGEGIQVRTGADLPFSVGDSQVIPEPSTFAIWSLLGLAGLGYGWRRRRAA